MLALGGCATTPRAEQTFRFPSNLAPPEALRCVTTRLRVERFDPVDQSPDTVVALREEGPGAASGTPQWSRLRVTMTRNDVGGTVVESLAGTGPSREGPFHAPDLRLQEVVSTLTAACTWP